MKTLLLWDIDGTLIDSGGAGERALRTSLREEFQIEDSLGWLDYFGRTDLWIARAILRHHGFEPSENNCRRFLDGYLAAVAQGMNNPHARVLPGVRTILDAAVASGGVAQGLLTGNLERGAKIKLGHLGLSSYFPFGAYADDSELRNDLGPHAVRRATEYHRVNFAADRVFVIGDTPHDIACGKIIGACTIAVATGRYTSTQLRAHEPTALFETLEDAAAFFACIAEKT